MTTISHTNHKQVYTQSSAKVAPSLKDLQARVSDLKSEINQLRSYLNPYEDKLKLYRENEKVPLVFANDFLRFNELLQVGGILRKESELQELENELQASKVVNTDHSETYSTSSDDDSNSL